MHDTAVIIGYVVGVDNLCGVVVKIEGHAWQDVLCHNGDVTITIRSCLLVLEAHRVAQLVHNNPLLQQT